MLCDDDVEFVRGDVVALVEEARGGRARHRAAGPRARLAREPRPHARAAALARTARDLRRGRARLGDRPGVDRRVLPAPGVAGDGLGARARVDGPPRGGLRPRRRRPRSTYLHLDPVGGTYDEGPERRTMAARPRRARHRGSGAPCRSTLATWRPWRRRPPWSRDGVIRLTRLAENRRRAAPATLLVDHWYSHAVGHVIEALRRCQGYHACDPELADRARPQSGIPDGARALCAPFVTDVFGVPYTSFGTPVGSPRRALRRIPRDWDYVVHHHAVDGARSSCRRSRGSAATTRRRSATSARRLAVGVAGAAAARRTPRTSSSGSRCPSASASVPVASSAADASIAVMPAGSGARLPLPVDGVLARHPRRARAALARRCRRPGRPARTAERERRAASPAARSTACSPRGASAIDAFDRPILEQLALVEASSRLRLARTRGSASPRWRSTRRGSRSRAATGTSTSSTASRSTRCCRRAVDAPRSPGAGRSR